MTSPAIDSSVAVIRALLTEDFDEYRRLNAELGPEANRAYALVLGAAFMEAAGRRFGKQHDLAEIVNFVARARAIDVGPEAVSAKDAERAIRAVLGEGHLMKDMDGHAIGAAQTAMLFALVQEQGISAESINSLLATAADEAEEYLQRREHK